MTPQSTCIVLNNRKRRTLPEVFSASWHLDSDSGDVFTAVTVTTLQRHHHHYQRPRHLVPEEESTSTRVKIPALPIPCLLKTTVSTQL